MLDLEEIKDKLKVGFVTKADSISLIAEVERLRQLLNLFERAYSHIWICNQTNMGEDESEAEKQARENIAHIHEKSKSIVPPAP